MTTSNPKSTARKSWQEEFGIRARFPRTGIEHVEKLLKSAWPPEVLLREDHTKKATEIVIRFPGTSQELPDSVREMYFRFGMTPGRAFEEVLRKKLRPTDQRTARAQLASVGYNAYRGAWLHVVRMLYFDQFHPAANQVLVAEIASLERDTRLNQGKGKKSEVDEDNLRRRYEDLLSKARLVHEVVTSVAAQNKDSDPRLEVPEIRYKVWEMMKRELYGTRAAHLIFSDRAFEIISKGEQHGAPVRLHVPGDWQPEDLAIALLAVEEGSEHKTMRKLIKRILRKSVTTPR